MRTARVSSSSPSMRVSLGKIAAFRGYAVYIYARRVTDDARNIRAVVKIIRAVRAAAD